MGPCDDICTGGVQHHIHEPAVAETTRIVAASGGKPNIFKELGHVFRDYWEYRELLSAVTYRDVRIRYKQAVMGFGWAIFMPILIVLSGVIIRYVMARFSGETLDGPIIAGITSKAVPWAFFVGAVGFGSVSLINNMELVTKIYFPREILPLSSCLAQAFDSSMGGVALLLALPFLGVKLSLAWLWIPLLALMIFLFTAGACIFLAAANLFFRDVKYIVNVLLTFGIFFTPVFIEPAMLGPMGAELIMLNPLSPMLEGLRLAVVEGHNLLTPLTVSTNTGADLVVWSPWYLGYALAWSTFAFLGASVVFNRLEFLFAEYV